MTSAHIESSIMRILMLSDELDSAEELANQVNQAGDDYTINLASWPAYSPALLGNADLIIVHAHDIVDRKRIVRMREITKLPILLISAIGDEEFLARLYAAGVDDYLGLPVSYPLLLAKLRVWQRWVVRLITVLYH
jgi:DNA-binding response OmpR family regulator